MLDTCLTVPPHLPDTSSSGILQLTGNASLAFSHELRNSLLEAMDKVDCLSIDASGITQSDLSTLQIFCAARHSAISCGKELSFSGQIPDTLSTTVIDSGFKRTYSANCMQKGGQPCLWDGCLLDSEQVTT